MSCSRISFLRQMLFALGLAISFASACRQSVGVAGNNELGGEYRLSPSSLTQFPAMSKDTLFQSAVLVDVRLMIVTKDSGLLQLKQSSSDGTSTSRSAISSHAFAFRERNDTLLLQYIDPELLVGWVDTAMVAPGLQLKVPNRAQGPLRNWKVGALQFLQRSSVLPRGCMRPYDLRCQDGF